MSHLRFFGSAVLTTLTIAIPSISTGQTAPSPEWSVITTTQIKPEFRQEFEAVQKEVTAAYKKAGVPYRYVVQTILGDLEEYVSIAPISKLAEMDGPSPLVKALGDAGSQRLLRKIGGSIMSAHRVTTIPGEYGQVTTMRLAPGKGAEFTAFMKDDYLPAMRKADVANLWVSRPVFGGDLNERVTVRIMHKLAELDGGPPTTKALGAEGAQKLSAKQARIVESVHLSIGHLRTDLSLMPTPEKPKTTAAK